MIFSKIKPIYPFHGVGLTADDFIFATPEVVLFTYNTLACTVDTEILFWMLAFKTKADVTITKCITIPISYCTICKL